MRLDLGGSTLALNVTVEDDHEAVHGLGDVAARLVIDCPPPVLVTAESTLSDIELAVVHGRPVPNARELFPPLRGLVEECTAEGVRWGFALARAVDASADGWQAWLDAATHLRDRMVCGHAAHAGNAIARVENWRPVGRHQHDKEAQP